MSIAVFIVLNSFAFILKEHYLCLFNASKDTIAMPFKIRSIYRMSRYSKEFPAVPISARPIRSLADKNTEFPINSLISKVEGATAEPESSHSNHTVPFISHIPPSNKFKSQTISFSDTKMG